MLMMIKNEKQPLMRNKNLIHKLQFESWQGKKGVILSRLWEQKVYEEDSIIH